MPDCLELTETDDGQLFNVRVLNTGEERVARYHHHAIGGVPLRWPCVVDPERPNEYQRWLHEGWAAVAVSRVQRR